MGGFGGLLNLGKKGALFGNHKQVFVAAETLVFGGKVKGCW